MKNTDINARIDRLPLWPYHNLVLVVIGASFFFAFFDVVTIGFALPEIAGMFGISAEAASSVVTSGLIGYIAGSLLYSRVGDLYGRKTGLYLSVATFSVGSLFSGLTSDLNWLIFWRFVAGMGIGAEIALATTYLGELSPAPLRGKYTGWAITAAFGGFATVPFFAMALVPNFTWGWRALLIIGALGGVLITIMRRNIPESARWLYKNNRYEEADEIVSAAEKRARDKTGSELPEIKTAGTGPSEAAPTEETMAMLFKEPYLKRLILLAVIWFVYYVGNYGWLTLAPELFEKGGIALKQSISNMAITGTGFVAGAVGAVYLSDKFERKYSVSAIALIWALMLLSIGFYQARWIIVLSGFIASATIGLLIPILYTYTGENFPTGSRATGIAISDGIGHLGGAFCGQIIFGIYSFSGFTGAFAGMAVTGLLTGVLILFGARTTGRSLERIA